MSRVIINFDAEDGHERAKRLGIAAGLSLIEVGTWLVLSCQSLMLCRRPM